MVDRTRPYTQWPARVAACTRSGRDAIPGLVSVGFGATLALEGRRNR